MPYTVDNPPNWLKNLPKGAISIGVRTFNAVYEQTKNEEQARMAAWAQIKRKYKKKGDKWVKLTSSVGSSLVGARPTGAPVLGASFTLTHRIIEPLLSKPLRWGQRKTSFILNIKTEEETKDIILDANPVTQEISTVMEEYKPPLYVKMAEVVIDKGHLTIVNDRFTFAGTKLNGFWQFADDKLVKMSEAEMDVQVCMAAKPENITFERKGDLLYFKALALSPGIWTGIDGHPMKYDAGVIKDGVETFGMQRIKSRFNPNADGHGIKAADVVGFTTGHKIDGEDAWVDGYVFDQKEIQAIEEDLAIGKLIGISPELKTAASLGTDGVYIAHKIKAGAFSFVDSPACKKSWLRAVNKVSFPTSFA